MKRDLRSVRISDGLFFCAALATVLSAISVILVSPPPAASGSVAWGFLGLSTACVIWLEGRPRIRRSVAVVVAVAAVHSGMALDARPAQIAALTVIGVTVVLTVYAALRKDPDQPTT